VESIFGINRSLDPPTSRQRRSWVGVAAVLLTAAAAMTPEPGRVQPRHLALGAAGGVAFAGAGLMEFLALSAAPAGPVVVLVFVAPVWVAIAARLLWGTPLGQTRAALIGLVLAGTALLVTAPGNAAVGAGPAGLALAGSVLSAGFFVSMANLTLEVGPRRAACLIAAAAAAVAMLAPGPGLIELERAPRLWFALAIGVLTAVALYLLCVGLARTSAVSGVAIAGAEPVVAALLAWLLLGEELTAVQLLGGLTVVVAVLQIARLPSAAPLVEPDGGDEDDADHHVLPEPLDPTYEEPVREDHRDQHSDDAARDRADPAREARPSDHDRGQGRDQLRRVTGRHARDPEPR
jgi:drug/metabolite transporter (DMT)-like permease